MDEIRIGIVGAGSAGNNHAGYISRGEVEDAELCAFADINPQHLKDAQARYGDHIKVYDSADELVASGAVDAVIVATPHYDHPPIGVKAFEKGLHVLLEKPVGVYTKQVKEVNEAANASGKIFGVMFNQRTRPTHIKMKDLLQSGELGELKRNCWLMTSWYRSQSYYNRGGWRATWGGEGGGVLLNQCPHQLDLWQWFCGLPKKVRAFCAFGKYHDIEVEDDVTAYVEYENGATGMFVSSTGEAPGTNMFEVAGNMGRIEMSAGNITFQRNRTGERQFNATHTSGMGKPEYWTCDVPVGGGESGHKVVTQKWIEAIKSEDSSLLVADGREGIRSLEISNAMLLSAWLDDWVELPIDEDKFFGLLKEQIAKSSYDNNLDKDQVMDLKGSF